MDSTTDRRLGHLQMEVKDLLREPQLEVHETPFQLKDSGPVSKVILSMQLRVGTAAHLWWQSCPQPGRCGGVKRTGLG